MEVSFELHDGIGLLRMDDGKMNAISAAALEDIAKAITAAEAQADAIPRRPPGRILRRFRSCRDDRRRRRRAAMR